MRFYLISDNIDTQVGLRLAGIEGEVVNDAAGVEDAFERAIKQTDIGIILVTRLLSDLCPGLLVRLKKEYARPLIIVIPDRHGTVGTDSIAEYVRDAIGIKL
ncbi:MAG: ATP synthase subunit F [Clostridiales bacterium]|nr:ATP synthase subunit F [Clostridiales bacterium]